MKKYDLLAHSFTVAVANCFVFFSLDEFVPSKLSKFVPIKYVYLSMWILFLDVPFSVTKVRCVPPYQKSLLCAELRIYTGGVVPEPALLSCPASE